MGLSRDLQGFFERYGAALANGDLETVADAYAYPSLVLGGPEIILVSTREDVKGAFASAAEGYRAEGFTRARPSINVVDDEGTGTVWVAVQWTYSSEDGSKQQLDAYRYLLRHHDDGYAIAALTTAPTAEA
ncbi:hypothetical protein [Arthrobacter pigmenti]